MYFPSKFTARWFKCSAVLLFFASIVYCIFVWKLHAIASQNQITQDENAKHTGNQKYIDNPVLASADINMLALPKIPNDVLRVDYHNYTLMALEAKQFGPGENGEAYKLVNVSAIYRNKLFQANGFNALASNDIALNRSLKDLRHPKCKEQLYPASLPSVSVVVPFHNEHLSTLLRTVVSVINRSPVNLLLEMLLVDDASTKAFLGASLDEYLRKKLPLARVIRLPKREGLIRARLAGAREAKGDVLVFLDSHTECFHNWLPPLLEPIAFSYRTVVCPFIDVIDYETFEYRPQDDGARGAFDWCLFYKRLPITEQDRSNLPQPFLSPVMAGGLFAISRKFFWELGGYDPGLLIWGGEQYELSFKVWQCGGRMLDAPCSRIGHIYRKYAPFPNPGVGDYLGKNYKRVAEVWMDEFAEFVYQHRPHYRYLNAGDITEQRALRQQLHCKPFRWFMTQVAYDLIKVYPPIEPPDYAHGQMRPNLSPELCVDGVAGEQVQLRVCSSEYTQDMRFTWHKDIRPGGGSVCLDVSSTSDRAPVTLYACHGLGGNQLWRYRPSSGRVEHGGNFRCLDHDPVTRELFVSPCLPPGGRDTQQWQLQSVDEQRLQHWDTGDEYLLTLPNS